MYPSPVASCDQCVDCGGNLLNEILFMVERGQNFDVVCEVCGKLAILHGENCEKYDTSRDDLSVEFP